LPFAVDAWRPERAAENKGGSGKRDSTMDIISKTFLAASAFVENLGAGNVISL
jgi:hypothetical protein